MDPLKIIRKLASEITDQKKPNPDFVYQRIVWAFVTGWEEGLQHCAGRRPVAQMDQYGNVIKIHRSIKDAARAVKSGSTGIKDVCKGKQHTHKGFHWRYVEGAEQIKKIIEGWQSKL